MQDCLRSWKLFECSFPNTRDKVAGANLFKPLY